MDLARSAERTKKLKIVPVRDNLVRFQASLEDRSSDAEGGELIHALTLAGTISLPDLVIRSIEATVDRQPFPECGASLAPVQQLLGRSIAAGFRAHVLEIMGRTRGCTHFMTLALDLAAAHTLTVFLRMRARVPYEDRNRPDGVWIGTGLKVEPRLENACVALSADSPVVKTAKTYKESGG